MALRLVIDFSHLNSCLIRDQPQVFPMGEEIRQQLGPECVVRTHGSNCVVWTHGQIGGIGAQGTGHREDIISTRQ